MGPLNSTWDLYAFIKEQGLKCFLLRTLEGVPKVLQGAVKAELDNGLLSGTEPC